MNIQALTHDSEEWSKISELFKKMYEEMESNLPKSSLKEDGHLIWTNSQKRLAGKTSLVAVAKVENNTIGFIHASISAQPQYFQASSSGHIGHIYISPAYRNKNIARDLFEFSKLWFKEKNQSTIQLQVLSGNPNAKHFWESLSFNETMTHYSISI